MSTPVTARLDDETVAALDRAVEAGLAKNRGAVISVAVRSWLSEHSEEAIVASYRSPSWSSREIRLCRSFHQSSVC